MLKGVRRKAVEAVATALKALHAAGFVHGDVHEANVLVKGTSDGGGIRLVDFDWSGRKGKDTYPVIPNSALEWHPGVARGKVMLAVHDTHACAPLAAYVENPAAATKVQTVTPPSAAPPPKLTAGPATLVEHKEKTETFAKTVSTVKTSEVPIAAVSVIHRVSGSAVMPQSAEKRGDTALHAVPRKGRGRRGVKGGGRAR